MTSFRIAVQGYLPELRYWQLRVREIRRQLELAEDKAKKVGARMRAAQHRRFDEAKFNSDQGTENGAALRPDTGTASGVDPAAGDRKV